MRPEWSPTFTPDPPPGVGFRTDGRIESTLDSEGSWLAGVRDFALFLARPESAHVSHFPRVAALLEKKPVNDSLVPVSS